jgi:spore coat polysaccharide biosynthesis protein SpsF
MLDLCGRPALWHIIENTKRAARLHKVCLATSTLTQDDPLAAIAGSCGIETVRGDPERVLDRIYGAAIHCKADFIVDIGGDCPFIYPRLIDEAIAFFMNGECDYLCNYEPPTFPEGFDINILTMNALSSAWELAIAPSQRIHPFSYLTRHKERFRVDNYAMSPDLSQYHWSLDFTEDAVFIRAVFERLYRPDRAIEIDDILELIEKDAGIKTLHQQLLRPKALHAFWNSPGMMRDMHHDIVVLAQMAQEAATKEDFNKAFRCYEEILSIAGELRRHSEFKKSQHEAQYGL